MFTSPSRVPLLQVLALCDVPNRHLVPICRVPDGSRMVLCNPTPAPRYSSRSGSSIQRAGLLILTF